MNGPYGGGGGGFNRDGSNGSNGGGGVRFGNGLGDKWSNANGLVQSQQDIGQLRQESLKRRDYGTEVRNGDQHPVLATLMKPILDNIIPWRLNQLCKEAGIGDMRALPHCNNNCYRWMLGMCEGKADNPRRCAVRPENLHPRASNIPDCLAIQMSQMLQSGVDKFMVSNGGKKPKKI